MQSFGKFLRLAVLAWLVACGGDAPARPALVRPDASAPVVERPAETGGLRTAMDLVANRAHASVYAAGRLVIDAGGPDFAKYTDGGWKTSWIFGERDGQTPVALPSNLSAAVLLPLERDEDGLASGELTLSLTLRALAPKQKVSVFLNDKRVGDLDVPSEEATVALTVPAALVQPGDNRLRLTFRSSGKLGSRRAPVALRQITIGAGGPPPAGPSATVLAGPVSLAGSERSALSVPGGASRLSFLVQIPEGGKLALAYGSAAAGVRVLVRVASDGMPTRVLHEGEAGARWREQLLDLGAWAGRAVRLDLVARGGAASWAAPRLLVPGPPVAATVEHKPFERIFIWMVDTFRADKMKVYNANSRVETPNYEAFARDSTRFAWAQVPGTWSLPSHASILTGVYPSVHKAVVHEAKLSRDVAFLAEEMKKAGFRTAIFSSNGYVSKKWGFERGWDMSRNFIRESLPNGAEFLWKTAKPWLLDNKDRRQFVYLATVDPHVIYNPRKEFLKKYWNKPYDGPIKPVLTAIQLGRIKEGTLRPNDTDKAYLEALYDAEVTQSDAAFGTFVADLRAAGLYETSAIVVVSDHGDEFFDHGDVGHAQSVYQELVHVPLMIRAAGVFPPGKVVEADVEAMDLYPTVRALGGLPADPASQGEDLAPLAADELGRSPRAALSQLGALARGMKSGRYRLILGQRVELYDEPADRREQKNVAGERPIALRQMRSVLGLLLSRENVWKKAAWGTAANVSAHFGEDAAAK